MADAVWKREDLQTVLRAAEVRPDEVFRRDGLGFVTGGFERGKMRVVRHDKSRLRCNGAVAEFIVIRVRGDDAKTILILLKNLWSFFQAPSGARSF